MNGVISVIVPVYNVAAYLPQCIGSILDQDYDKLEVILIDDGSRDESGAICDAWAAKDPRIRVIHQKNGGAASAKNAGLRVAGGEYLSFVDSDDFLEPNVYGYMAALLESSGADAVQFAFRDVWKNRTEDRIVYPGRELVDSSEYLRRLVKDYSCPLLWNKLYRRELYEGIFFEEGHKIDDEYFTYQGFLKDRKVLFDDRIIYNYRRRGSSVMGSREAAHQRLLDRIDYAGKRRAKVIASHPELRRLYNDMYLDLIWSQSKAYGNTEQTIRQIQKTIRAYFRTPGATLPPRYLWRLLWRLDRADPKALLEKCAAPEETDPSDLLFE